MKKGMSPHFIWKMALISTSSEIPREIITNNYSLKGIAVEEDCNDWQIGTVNWDEWILEAFFLHNKNKQMMKKA